MVCFWVLMVKYPTLFTGLEKSLLIIVVLVIDVIDSICSLIAGIVIYHFIVIMLI
jgi:hypothetical protein